MRITNFNEVEENIGKTVKVFWGGENGESFTRVAGNPVGIITEGFNPIDCEGDTCVSTSRINVVYLSPSKLGGTYCSIHQFAIDGGELSLEVLDDIEEDNHLEINEKIKDLLESPL